MSSATAYRENITYKATIILKLHAFHPVPISIHWPYFCLRTMTSEQAAQLIDTTLDLVHQRLQDLESQALIHEHHALAEEFREWRHPIGGHIDLMVFPGLAS